MPVPVPPVPPAHQIIKNAQRFASRPINSTFRIWEDDCRRQPACGQEGTSQQGLTGSQDQFIKGSHVHHNLPPKFINQHALRQSFDQSSGMLASDSVNQIQMAIDYPDHYQSGNVACMNEMQYESQSLWRQDEWGAFTPIFEDQSPDGDSRGTPSPMEPVTPFGDFIDRALGDSATNAALSYPVASEHPQGSQGAQAAQTNAHSDSVSAPSATESYKRLALPLAEWMANYVWKVCVTGMDLPQSRVPIAKVAIVAGPPPSYLAGSIHSMLLSTLLQPSAVFLAMWYITRLPVYFGSVGLGADHVKELRFRVALLGDSRGGMDRGTMEVGAPFRLVILGCMLANKWLDDHTFSNKTWHTISNLPIQDINKLEALALDVFSHDLSISRFQWSQLLDHMLDYHQMLGPPSHHPQPITRPSLNPHSIVRRAIEDIIQAPPFNPGSVGVSGPQPIFMGLEQRKLEKFKELKADINNMDFDMDEDGPLRQEYVPRRRVVEPAYRPSSMRYEPPAPPRWTLPTEPSVQPRYLPPPAKWSPSGDEPIARHRLPMVQPTYAPVQYMEIPRRHEQPPAQALCWSFGCDTCVQPKCNTSSSWQQPAHPLHTRSISLSHGRGDSAAHYRSYSQSRNEYKCSDIRTTANEVLPAYPASWNYALSYGYQPTYAPHHNATYAPAWVRA